MLFSTISYFVLIFTQVHADFTGNSSSSVISKQYRLDKFILPESYDIAFQFEVNFNATRKFLVEKCRIKININPDFISSNVSKIRLHYTQMHQENSVTLMDKNGKYLAIKMGEPNKQTDIVEIHLINCKLDLENQPYTIEFTNLTGMLRDDNHGIYVGEYVFKDQVKLLLATDFPPAQARLAFPCFDEPSSKLKAHFQISLTVPRSFTTVLGNTKKISEQNKIGQDLKIIKFDRTPKMLTCQVVFLISTFEHVTSEINPNVNIYYHEGIAPYVQYAADITPRIIKKLEQISQLNYTNPSNPLVNEVVLPTSFYRSTAYIGLILNSDTFFLYDVQKSTKDEQRWAFIEICASLSRTLLVNINVSLEWWSHSLWLFSGLALYFLIKIETEIVPELELDGKLLTLLSTQKTFDVDGAFNSIPLASKEEDIYNISSIYKKIGIINYYKSPVIILMMESILGEEKLLAVIRKFLSNHDSRNITPSLFFEIVASEGLPFNKMKEWIEESGYPVVTVKRVNNSAILTQKRFLLQNNRKSHTKWHIPITYASKTHNKYFENVTFSHWLNPHHEELLIEDAFQDSDWIIVNINQYGYYRINYEENLWPNITQALNSANFGGIPAIIRARLVDDVMNMARVMRQSYRLAMDVTKYLEKETDYYPWSTAYNAFSYLLKRIGKKTELGKLLKKYVASLSGSFSQSLERELKEGLADNTMHILKTDLIVNWFCDYDYPDYVPEQRKQFQLYKTNPSNFAINANSQYATLCYGVKYGNTSDWNFVYDLYKKSTFPNERRRILQALGCSKEAVTLRRFLEMTLDPTSDIKKHDNIYIFSAVLKSNIEVAQAFLLANIEGISHSYASWNALPTMVSELTDEFTTVAQIAEFKIFVENNQVALKEAWGDLAQSKIQSAAANVKWLATFENEITEWLTEELAYSRSNTSYSYLHNSILIILIALLFSLLFNPYNFS